MNRTTSAKPTVRHLRLLALALALGLWGALVLLFAAPLALTGRVSWPQAVSFGGAFWVLWLLFLPAVAWLAFRFPIEPRRRLRNVGLHLLACLLLVGTSRATFRAIARIFPAPQRRDAPRWSPDAKMDKPEPSNALEVFPVVLIHQHRSVFLSFRAALDVLVYWSLVGVCQAIMNFRSSQERERRTAELEARLTSAKLQALRMQLNPHFLFNTLNSIATLIYVNPRAADEMLGDLSALLRRSFNSMEEQEIPLAQELEFIGAYLSIEQKRFGERLRVEQRVPKELVKALVPALILQPLVENAIRHGIEPQRGSGLISLEAKQEDKQLHLIVSDNGRGRPGADLNGSGRRGIGLANTKARLQGLYGRDQSFSFGRAEPQGCRVEIRLPFHLEPVAVSTVSNEPAA